MNRNGPLTKEQIVELRNALGWTQVQFAQLFRVNPRTIQHWEAGTTEPDQYQAATLLQLKFRLDAAIKQKRAEKFRSDLMDLFGQIVFGAGIGLLLAFLFTDKKE